MVRQFVQNQRTNPSVLWPFQFFLNDCVSWALTSVLRGRIQALEMKCYNTSLGISYKKHQTRNMPVGSPHNYHQCSRNNSRLSFQLAIFQDNALTKRRRSRQKENWLATSQSVGEYTLHKFSH